MAHINLENDLPGIRGLMAFRPQTAPPLNDLAEVLLRSESTLSPGHRELIATYVSYLNDCYFCQHSHGGYAQYFLQCDARDIDRIKEDFNSGDLPDKIKALLAIAAKVTEGGKSVTPEVIKEARKHGATDVEIHDTVLLAAAFCMYNRYVDGLGTWAPEEREYYIERGKERARIGYANYNPIH